jgi:predicted RNA-binding protein with PUA-like domain
LPVTCSIALAANSCIARTKCSILLQRSWSAQFQGAGYPSFTIQDWYLSMPYLLKTEPDAYSFADLERDGETIWDGVTNPAAVKYLREMKAGEKLVVYHTGTERSAVGAAGVVSVDASDPKVPKVRIRAGKRISEPRDLASIKALALFGDSPLVKQGRLSVVPLTEKQYEWLIGK